MPDNGNFARVDGGNSIPPGNYRIEYVTGCMRYDQDTTIRFDVHAFSEDCNPRNPGIFLVDYNNLPSYSGGCVGATTGYIVRAPGNDRQTGGPGAFTTQGACITENESRPPVDFVHTGGEMAFRVYDENYNDNSDGPVVFSLTRTDC